jgi:DNA repair protein RecN (Recombination protein N)
MLTALSISNIVLIEEVHLEFLEGFTALTGETGAGKSIVLDALGLALGARAERAQIRQGEERAWAAASFRLAHDHPALQFIHDAELDLAGDHELTLRRILTPDGRTRCFINDMPVSAMLLRQVGETLVEIHGQHDGRGLLNRATHRSLLDSFLRDPCLVEASRRAFEAYHSARSALDHWDIEQTRLAREAEHIAASLDELDALAPEAGEEARLVEERRQLQQVARMADALSATREMLSERDGFEDRLGAAYRSLEPFVGQGEEPSSLLRAAQAIDKVLIELDEAREALQEALHAVEIAPERQEAVEARLFALRAAARKHGVSIESLVELRQKFADAKESVDAADARRAALAKGVRETRQHFESQCKALSVAREEAAGALDERVNGELAALKLGRARFRTSLVVLSPDQWSAHGAESIGFEVETNPGAGFGPLAQIASGGEMSRFSLALRVALATRGGSHVFIFDEIDQGVGGSTADAIGKRLSKLGVHSQVLVVTHSPQVAASASMQIQIEKEEGAKGGFVTRLRVLEQAEREREIARMLAGESVTKEALAAARALLAGAAS